MHPLGSIDILVAAGDIAHLLLSFSLLHFPLSVHHSDFQHHHKHLKALHSCYRYLWAIGLHASNLGYFLPWLLIAVFTKQIEVTACPCAGASLLLGAEGHEERGWPTPKTPNLSQICTLWASTCVF